MKKDSLKSDDLRMQKKKLAQFCNATLFGIKLQEKTDNYLTKHEYSKNKIIGKLLCFFIKSLFSVKFIKRSVYRDNLCHILFVPDGGIGDHLHFIKYCYCLKQKFKEQVKIDILLKSKDEKLKEQLYKNLSFIDNVFCKVAPRHDVEISVVRFPKTKFIDLNRLFSLNNSEFISYLEKITEFEFANRELYRSDYLGRCYSLIFGRKRENQPDVLGLLNMTGTEDFMIKYDDKNSGEILEKYGLKSDEYIIFQTGSGRPFQDVKDETRQWPIEYYSQLVQLLKKKFPDKKIVQCGVENQNEVENTDVCLLGKTSFNELMVLLDKAFLLVSQEGGYPIIRHYISRKPSCVLFGPTDINFFGFEENINVSSKICPGCEWINKNWYKKCMLNGERAICMQNLKPSAVMTAIEERGL